MEEKIYTHTTPLDEQGIKQVKHLIDLLGSRSGIEREAARKEIVAYGKLATPYLVEALKSDNHFVRWESAKALGVLADPASAMALVKTLMDEDVGVRWLASEGLIALRDTAIEPLLHGMVKNFNSIWFRQGCYHVLHVFERESLLDTSTQEVLEALRSIEPQVSVPGVAERALEKREKT